MAGCPAATSFLNGCRFLLLRPRPLFIAGVHCIFKPVVSGRWHRLMAKAISQADVEIPLPRSMHR
jgi:hypothetical protein